MVNTDINNMPIISIIDPTQGKKVAGGYIIKSPISRGDMRVYTKLNQWTDETTGRWGGVLELATLLWHVTEDEAAARLTRMKEEQRHEPQPSPFSPVTSQAPTGEQLNQWAGGVEEGTGFFYFHKWSDGSHVSGYRREQLNHYEVWDAQNQRWGAADVDASTPPDDVARAAHEEIEEATKKAAAGLQPLTPKASHDADGVKNHSIKKNVFILKTVQI